MSKRQSGPDPIGCSARGMPPPGTVVACRGLKRSFQEADLSVDVLREVDFDVEPGERIAIVGASGSGKSTLLHLLGGLDRPSAGEVWLDGKGLTGMSEKDCGVLRNSTLGFVYQFHHLLAEFTALENVSMPLLIRRESVAEAKDKAAQVLEQVGLGERLRHKPGELSGGERQRAAIARALVTNPKCLLADEPTGNLDRKSAERVFDLVLERTRSGTTAVVVVTHDIELARKMDKVLTIVDGQMRPAQV